MKRSSLTLLLLSASAAALVAACSAGPDSGGLLGRNTGPGGGPSAGTTTTGSGSSGNAASSGGMSSGGGTTGGTSSGGTPSGGTPSGGTPTPVAPPPDAGPGSTTSAGHVFFNATVYPELSVCAACHASGANGAPTMMAAPADTTYSQLDALGLIQANSLLLTKGTHDNGAAPALTSQQSADISTWLGMEAQERAGSAAPTNILAEVAKCASQTDWNAIGWGKLRTKPRTTENPNKCSGCNNAMCASCHDGGEQGFFMSEGSNIEPPGTTFQQTFSGPSAMTYVIQYFGLNGTTPIASNAIMLKQTAVATGPAYSHPMFTMSTTMQTALSTFVTNTITNYNNHTCTGGTTGDGGAGDGGP